MDVQTLEELLAAEGVEDAEVEALLAWAHDRARTILEQAGDPDLAALLQAPPPAAYEPGVSLETGPSSVNQGQPEAMDAAANPAEGASEHALRADQPLPPIPSSRAASELAHDEDEDEIEELDDIELLEDDDLELMEDADESSEDADESSEGADESSEGADESSEGDVAEPGPPNPDAAAAEAPSFGPPDGTDNVPEWKAALYSAELGDDSAAAARIREESYLGPAPQPVQSGNTQPTRLEPEEDEISQHRIDLSDLGD